MQDHSLNTEIFQQPAPNIYMLVTVSEDCVYGFKDSFQLPFLSNDYDYSLFNELTANHCVLVGRKTWICLKNSHLLSENKQFIVLTKNKDFASSRPNTVFLNSFYDAVNFWGKEFAIKRKMNLWICGGPSLFNLALKDSLIQDKIKNIYTVVVFKKIKNKSNTILFNVNQLEDLKWEMDGNFIIQEQSALFKWKKITKTE